LDAGHEGICHSLPLADFVLPEEVEMNEDDLVAWMEDLTWTVNRLIAYLADRDRNYNRLHHGKRWSKRYTPRHEHQ
jgi:hypothetical protein